MNNKDFNEENPILGSDGMVDEDFFDDDEKDCPFAHTLISLTLLPRLFGMPWKSDKMEKFLKGRGYRIINRHDDDEDEDFKVAIKPGESMVPETSNLLEVFTDEVQEVLLDWMLSLKK